MAAKKAKTPGEAYYDEEAEDTEAKETAPRKPEDGKVDERFVRKSKMKKGDGDGDGDEDDVEDEDLGKGKKVKKSLAADEDIDKDDLLKSLTLIERYAQRNDPQNRKDQLLAQAREGELSKSEREELFGLLGGQEAREPTLGDHLTKGLADNDTLQKALDVSDFLSEQHDELVKSLQTLGDALEAVDTRQSEFNLLLSKALVDVGHAVRGVAGRLGVLEQQPARGPKSRGVAPLQKSFAGAAPAGEQLNKSEVLDTLTALNQQSFKEGRGGLSKSNEDITHAIAKYEQTQALSQPMLAEVRAFARSQRGAA